MGHRPSPLRTAGCSHGYLGLTSTPPYIPTPWTAKGKKGHKSLFHSTSSGKISICYKKLVRDPDLQVHITLVLAKVQILTNEMDGGQYPIGIQWFLKHSDACHVAGELHLIRHLGAGGEEICPGREDSSGGSPNRPSASALPGQLHRKPP